MLSTFMTVDTVVYISHTAIIMRRAEKNMANLFLQNITLDQLQNKHIFSQAK